MKPEGLLKLVTMTMPVDKPQGVLLALMHEIGHHGLSALRRPLCRRPG
jgi:uncharacterized protein (DUF3820 family)